MTLRAVESQAWRASAPFTPTAAAVLFARQLPRFIGLDTQSSTMTRFSRCGKDAWQLRLAWDTAGPPNSGHSWPWPCSSMGQPYRSKPPALRTQPLLVPKQGIYYRVEISNLLFPFPTTRSYTPLTSNLALITTIKILFITTLIYLILT